VTKAWPPISHAVRLPRNDGNYQELVQLLDRVTDEVGEDENHPPASLMDVLGVLIEKYEDEGESASRSPPGSTGGSPVGFGDPPKQSYRFNNTETCSRTSAGK
jgi:HTH-type transcriptional regulator / antitoxin HigA